MYSNPNIHHIVHKMNIFVWCYNRIVSFNFQESAIAKHFVALSTNAVSIFITSSEQHLLLFFLKQLFSYSHSNIFNQINLNTFRGSNSFIIILPLVSIRMRIKIKSCLLKEKVLSLDGRLHFERAS